MIVSLKAFHIVFIIASTLLALGCGAWALVQFKNEGGWNHLAYGAASLVCAIALICYGRYFLKKLKNVSYL